MTMQMEQGRQAGAAATGAAKDVAHEAADGARAVAAEAMGQAQQLYSDAKQQLSQQVDTRTHEAADGLRSLAEQLRCLAEGRPEEAGQLTGLLDQARTKVMGFADTMEQRGPRGALDEASRYARRRPGMFLLGAVAAGFAVGRLVRAGASSSHSSSDGVDRLGAGTRYGALGTGTTRTGAMSAGTMGTGTMGPGAMSGGMSGAGATGTGGVGAYPETSSLGAGGALSGDALGSEAIGESSAGRTGSDRGW